VTIDAQTSEVTDVQCLGTGDRLRVIGVPVDDGPFVLLERVRGVGQAGADDSAEIGDLEVTGAAEGDGDVAGLEGLFTYDAGAIRATTDFAERTGGGAFELTCGIDLVE
jgi:hypothetical protein